MDRRRFVGAAAALLAAAAAPARLRAQSKSLPRVTLVLSTPDAAKPRLEAFTARLRELGYIEGHNVAFEKRWYELKTERLPAIAQEIVALKPAVIVVGGTPSAMAVKNATSTIPVVFISVAEPDGRGFVASMARPGGNMTGTSFRAGAMNTKVMEAVRVIFPAVRRVAMLEPAGDPVLARMRPLVQKQFESMGFEAEWIPVKDAGDLPGAIDGAARRKFDLLFAHPLALLIANARRIAELALVRRLVLVGPRRLYAEAGALLSYDNDLVEEYRAAAGFVQRILKGANPGDLPVEQPDRFHLVLNQRTAKALGIKFPQSLLVQATEVIE